MEVEGTLSEWFDRSRYQEFELWEADDNDGSEGEEAEFGEVAEEGVRVVVEDKEG